MKKGLKKLAVILAAVSLTGCQSDIEPAADIAITTGNNTKADISEAVEAADIPVSNAAVADKSNESTDISADEAVATDSGEEDFIPRLLMDTDKPFVLAEENYIIEKQDIDVSVFNEYGLPHYSADGKYYYAEHTLEKNNYQMEMIAFEEASICVYDSESGEYSPLYSETPSGDFNVLEFDIIGLHDNFLYYFREECRYGSQSSISEGLDLCRLNLENKKSEHIFSLNNHHWFVRDDNITIVGSSLFFGDYFDINLETDEYVHIIYRFDLSTGEVSLFRDDAENVIPYKNGLLYCHDGGYYYHGDDRDIKGKGVFYEGDELVFSYEADDESEKLLEINIKGDTVLYICNAYYPDGAESRMGILDEEFNQIEIASTKKGTWCIYANSCKISESGLIFVYAPKPLIYDMQTDSFAMISIDDYSNYISYATEDGICFFVVDYADDAHDSYLSAALYTVKRR